MIWENGIGIKRGDPFVDVICMSVLGQDIGLSSTPYSMETDGTGCNKAQG